MRGTPMLLHASRRATGLVLPICLAVSAACSGGDHTAAATTSAASGAADSTAATAVVACDPGNGGITLPQGFCATIYADHVGGARHVAVAPDGAVYVALMRGARDSSESGASGTGGILALADTDHDGHADARRYFGDLGGTGVAVHDGALYADAVTAIVRYPLQAGQLAPTGKPDTIVRALPTGGHGARNMAFTRDGALLVNVGSRTNSCQKVDRTKGSPGIDPCTRLETRAGIWKFDPSRTGQTQATGEHFVTGLRNGMGIAIEPTTGQVYATQHGRDQLYGNWPEHFTAKQSAELPAEELVQANQGDDFGWPYCYYDQNQKKLVLAPEYGGDGQQVGRCSGKKGPVVAFPGHWAPMSLAFYTGRQFPERYRGGAFIAFHGSWNRAPEPQEGYRVVFVPFSGAKPTGQYEDFATGFAGSASPEPGSAEHRPVGLAVAPDGALFVTDDAGGRIWRVVYRGQ